jgi:hypothetical protein
MNSNEKEPTVAKTEELVQQEQAEHDALEQARRDSPFADLETQDGRTIGQLEADVERENEEATEPERELEDGVGSDSEASDEEGKPEETKPDPEGAALFDRSQYEREGMQIPKVDGQSIDRIAVAVTGEIMLDRSNEADVALYNRLALGREVELRVAGKVQATGAKGATNRDGDLDVVVGKKTVKVDTVWVLQAEDL